MDLSGGELVQTVLNTHVDPHVQSRSLCISGEDGIGCLTGAANVG